jgi:hypothetical protein
VSSSTRAFLACERANASRHASICAIADTGRGGAGVGVGDRVVAKAVVPSLCD